MNALQYAGQTDPGRVREENQDRWAADPQQGLFLVADGMGGTAGGKLAADIVAEVLPRLIAQRVPAAADLAAPTTQVLVVGALAEMSERLRDASRGRLSTQGMGSTVVLALVRGGRALIVHLGDSRAYLLHSRRFTQLTRDHSLAEELVEHGVLTAADAPGHYSRARLTRFVGMEGKSLPAARLVPLAPGDRLLLCSDGLSGPLEPRRLAALTARRGPPAEVCRGLVAAANEAGGKDNITALLVVAEATNRGDRP